MSNAKINPDDLRAIVEQRKTLYQVGSSPAGANKQGLWLGGERIWLGDMVRLKKPRSELPYEDLGLPSDGVADRAVLLTIKQVKT